MGEDAFLEAQYEERYEIDEAQDEEYQDYIAGIDDYDDDPVGWDSYVLMSAGMGTDEDYGYYGEEE